MKRITDVVFSICAGMLLSWVAILVAVAVRLTSKGPILYWSPRVGCGGHLFHMPKFRTMIAETPDVASHELKNADRWLTPIGRFLRRSSLDEMPQLWCVFTGAMSLVGPRPALFSQKDLIALRKEYRVDTLAPGLTGWAQINGRDAVEIPEKVALDAEYLERQSWWFDLKILFLTIPKVLRGSNIRL